MKYIHEICPLHFNPWMGAPCWTHTHIYMHMHRLHVPTTHTLILEWWAANYSAQGACGYAALLKDTSAVTRRWTAIPPAVSPPILFFSSEWGSNRQPSGHWTTTLTEPQLLISHLNKGTITASKQPATTDNFSFRLNAKLEISWGFFGFFF